MKKFIAMIMTLLLMMATLVACGNTPSTDPSTSNPIETTMATEPSSTAPSTDDPSEDKIPSSFSTLPSAENLIETYQMEVKYRLSREEYFTIEEREYLAKHEYDYGYRCIREYANGALYTYAYPVVYRVEDDIVIAYSRAGILSFEGEYEVTNNLWKIYGSPSVHTSQLTEEEKEIAEERGSVAYNSTSGSVSFWEFGELVATHTVPAGAVYAGVSDWEGYIFRAGSEVYAVALEGSRKIADGVSVVILADYYAGSDDWSQPLFLMQDGSLKVYCSWYGDREAPADDPCHLQDICYEGGYRG